MKKAAFLSGLILVGLAVVLGLALARARADAAGAYARERATQRRAVAATRSVESAKATTDGATPGAAKSTRAACVVGLETFAVAVERSLLPLPEGRARRVAALKALSEAAVRAERTAELARPAPTLPRRMGLEDGQPVVADKRACDGAGYADLR
jgi:hypothetical protein